MKHVIKLLEKELKKLEETKSPNFEFNDVRLCRIEELKQAIIILKEKL